MTNKTEKKSKQKAAYHLWLETPDGNTRYAGTAYRHKKGNGLNLLIGGLQYVAFEPKEKSAEGGRARERSLLHVPLVPFEFIR